MTTEAHVINLADRTDRWELMKEAWKDQPLTLVRREAIRLALYRANEDPLLAEPAFEVFFA
jgi:hypothetical protein